MYRKFDVTGNLILHSALFSASKHSLRSNLRKSNKCTNALQLIILWKGNHYWTSERRNGDIYSLIPELTYIPTIPVSFQCDNSIAPELNFLLSERANANWNA
jgi:hypothetical protein